MIGHIVMWKLQPGKDKEQAYREIKPALERLVGIVPGLTEATVHKCYDGFDLCLCTRLASPADLKVYQNHPEHLKAKAIVHSYMADRVAADFEL